MGSQDNTRKEDFRIEELHSNVSEEEVEQLLQVVLESLKGTMWLHCRFDGLSQSETNDWLRRFWLKVRIDDVRYRTFAIRDLSTNKLIGYTGLQCPFTPDEATAALFAKRLQEEKSCLPPSGQAFWQHFATYAQGMTNRLDYDPTKHFHKRNTYLHPAYHNRGLGTWLTAYCNDVADQSNVPTYVFARFRAWRMLEKTGFVLGYSLTIDAEQFGWHGDKTVEDVRAFKREPFAGV